jgi:hypothetical protein
MHKAWAILPIRLEFHWVINSLRKPSVWAQLPSGFARAEILADTLKGAPRIAGN